MTVEEAIECLECGASPDCFLCPTNKKHGGDCEGAELVCEALNMALEILEKVRDGRMLELPCKVGDTVYKILDVEWDIGEFEIYCFTYLQNDHITVRFSAECHSHDVDDVTFYSDEIGKTIFLTREEAENNFEGE